MSRDHCLAAAAALSLLVAGITTATAQQLPNFKDDRRLPIPGQAAAPVADAAADAKRKADEDARRVAEAEDKRKADEDARRVAEAEAKRKADEDARRVAAAEAKRKSDEEALRSAEANAAREAQTAAASADAQRLLARGRQFLAGGPLV